MSKDLLLNTEEVQVPQFSNIAIGYQTALQVVDDVILKNYITNLSNLDVIPLNQKIIDSNIDENVLFFKITEMVYEKDEFASYKFASVFNTLATSDTAIFLIIDSNGNKTDFYMGIRSFSLKKTTSSLRNTLENAMIGQFPGIKTKNYDLDEIKKILSGIKSNSISSVSCVANLREENLKNNQEFVQGLEKLVLSMSGQKYTGIIIANSTDQNQLKKLRREYENVYTQLSPFATMQVNYAQNSSIGQNESTSTSTTQTKTLTTSESDSFSTTESHGTSKENSTSKTIKGVAAAAGILGAALAPVTGGTSLAIGGVVAGGLGLLGSALSNTVTDSISKTNSKTYGESTSLSEGTTNTNTIGKNLTEGLSKAITLTAHDKTVEGMLSRIDKQLKRMDEFESLGMYECAAYFMSDDQYTAEIAATTYKAIMKGENSGVEIAAINSWGSFDKEKTRLIEQYVKNFIHPVFDYKGPIGSIEVTPSSMVSCNELAIHMGLPRKSVSGLPVIKHIDFGKEVVRYDQETTFSNINLGTVFNMGRVSYNEVRIDKKSLSMHIFVTGSTGAGKSNTIYEIIRQTNNLGANFMVIEPAKGEYKNVFGNRPDVMVYGTNPSYSDLLKINPFSFPNQIHILEHVDRLVEIFNVCWPMYAAMPAVLKDALLKTYENCGWDLSSSKNNYGNDFFPTFTDLQNSLVDVITKSAYSDEVKSNYTGSLVTRVTSLTNGLNGQIFSSNEIPCHILFDKNVIIDLSRIGSLETKSLIMGILIMKLSEHRMSTSDSMNVPFKHMTVLEEAHNILKRTSSEQNSESPSLTGKSVEMISNAISEMRTYGEGFVIVDQSPSILDPSAIRNTNTKIILRLPDEKDRRLAGKAAGLQDEQLDEITKLPKGVAVVYQNDWVEPVLCKVHKFRGTEEKFQYNQSNISNCSEGTIKKRILEFLLKNRVKKTINVDIESIKKDLPSADISTKSKLIISKLVHEYQLRKDLMLWKEDNFDKLAKLVSNILKGNYWVKSILENTSDFDELTENVMRGVEEQVKELNLDLTLASAQCLMKAEASCSNDCMEIYSAWITSLRNKETMHG